MDGVYEVIMAGGSGSRFWPLSRQTMPKQLLSLDGRDTMLNETIARMEPLVDRNRAYIVTNTGLAGKLKETLLPGVPKEQVLAEPIGRNTAPCILYAAMVLRERDQDGIMCVLPADHHIADTDAYRQVMRSAIEAAQETNALVTIGITPTYPATGYGYIACGEETPLSGVRSVARFVEKPPLADAERYLSEGKYLWNSGMFVWKNSAILEAFENYLPDMYAAMQPLCSVIGTKQEAAVLAEIYPTLAHLSVDYGIMERSDNVLVLAGDFGWNDVGSLDELSVFHPADEAGNVFVGDVVSHDSRGCIVYGGNKLTALIGTEDLMVIDTEDALLICPRNRAQDVRAVTELLEAQGRKER